MNPGRLQLVILLKTVLLFSSLNLAGKGIIVADDAKQTLLFNGDSIQVAALADHLAGNWDRVILHLGRSYVFRSGNIYSSPKSQANLKIFAERLKQRKVSLTLWFLDSWGKESFRELYAGYREICSENLQTLQRLAIPYDGIAVDLEWINSKRGHNNGRLVNILTFLRNNLGKEKKLWFFASLNDNDRENRSRGYTLSRLLRRADAPIAMIYPGEEGFTLEDGEIIPRMSDYRIGMLKKHCRQKKWEVAVSLKNSWVYGKGSHATIFRMPADDPEYLSSLLKPEKESAKEYWVRKTFRLMRKESFPTDQGGTVTLQAGTRLQFFGVNRKILEPGYFTWEYFDLLEQEKEGAFLRAEPDSGS